MKRIPQLLLSLTAFALLAQAAGPVQVPEVDGATAVSAVALVGGAILVLRSRTRK